MPPKRYPKTIIAGIIEIKNALSKETPCTSFNPIINNIEPYTAHKKLSDGIANPAKIQGAMEYPIT